MERPLVVVMEMDDIGEVEVWDALSVPPLNEAAGAAALEARVAVLVERVTAAHAQVREISPRPGFPAGDFGYRGMRGAVGKDTCSLCKRTLQPAPSTGVVAFYC